MFEKWKRKRTETRPLPPPETPPPPVAPKRAPRLAAIALAGLAGAALLVGGYWYVEIRPRMQWLSGEAPAPKTKRVRIANTGDATFDRSLELPARPMGLAWNGRELVAAAENPAGLLRIAEPRGAKVSVTTVPVTETVYSQQIGFRTLTWNGETIVGYTTGSWFQSPEPYVFTLHARDSWQVLSIKPAPPQLGCLAWDGEHYWAATRANTETSGEPVFLYQLDRAFQVVKKHPAPGVGCQGLAWDGRLLWFADVFSDTIHLLDVRGEAPRIVSSNSTSITYLSGVAWDGSDIWVAEYGENRLLRLRSSVRLAWSGGDDRPQIAAASAIPAPASGAGPDVDQLQRMLRSDDRSERMRAEFEMSRRGIPAGYDREQDSFAKREREDTDLLDFSAELRDGVLRASWHAWVGEEFFVPRTPSSSSPVSIPLFARYEVTVSGGSLPREIRHSYDARPGDNIQRDVMLASGLGPGKYSVSFFIHVQYVTSDGTPKILNDSAGTLFVEQ